MATKTASYSKPLSYDGHRWFTVIDLVALNVLLNTFAILDSVEVPTSSSEAVDIEGNTAKVALYSSMVSHGMRLPFCHLICDILDFLSMAPTHVHTNAWRILMSCCVMSHMVLESIEEVYLDLTV